MQVYVYTAIDYLWYLNLCVEHIHSKQKHSCQVCEKRGRDKVYDISNARKARAKNFGPRLLLSGHTHYLGDPAQIPATTPTKHRDRRTKTG